MGVYPPRVIDSLEQVSPVPLLFPPTPSPSLLILLTAPLHCEILARSIVLHAKIIREMGCGTVVPVTLQSQLFEIGTFFGGFGLLSSCP